MNLNDDTILSPEEYLKGAKRSYEYYSQLAAKYKRVIDAFEGTSLISSSVANFTATFLQNSSPARRKRIGGTFADVIIGCLEAAGKPQFTGDLMELVRETGRHVSTSSNFGSQLNSAAKTNPEFKRDKVDGKLVWGLAEWFIGNRLKDEYILELLALLQLKNG